MHSFPSLGWWGGVISTDYNSLSRMVSAIFLFCFSEYPIFLSYQTSQATSSDYYPVFPRLFPRVSKPRLHFIYQLGSSVAFVRQSPKAIFEVWWWHRTANWLKQLLWSIQTEDYTCLLTSIMAVEKGYVFWKIIMVPPYWKQREYGSLLNTRKKNWLYLTTYLFLLR